MAATLHHPPQTSASTNSVSGANDSNKNPQLKRIVYSKYRELLGSYNDKANAIIETLPAYMVREDRGFNFVASGPPRSDSSPVNAASKYSPADEMYGQRGGGSGGGGYEAPACVQNAMMTKDKKPFTYTPGGIDLSQIKSERMAKRLARNAQAEGATGASQQNRPTQPVSSNGGGGSPVGATSAMGAAALGMPFQVLPPPPPPQPGAAAVGKKSFNGNPAPPPPPPQSSLAPPNNGRTSAPNSPSMARKSPTPQRFEPPPLGFRPEIKIPSNPMAALRKVPPPVEKNTFWKDEYVKERSKSPMPDNDNSASGGSPSVGHAGTVGYGEQNQYGVNGKDLVDVAARKPGTPQQQLPETGGYNNYAPYIPTPPAPLSAPQQHQQNIKPPTPPTPPQQQSVSPHTPCSEFRSVPVPQSPAVSIYTRQADSPLQQQRATESPFRYAQQQQMQSEQQQRPPIAISPLAQQSTSPVAAPSATDSAHQPQTQTVPWRIQRNQPAAATQPQQQSQSIYNNVQNQQRSRDVFSPGKMEPTTTASSPQLPQNYSTQQLQYQGPKPTNVGSLYIAPLGPTTSEPQAQNIIRQQLQQEQTRDSPMRQIPQQQQQLGWLRSQPASKEQVPWARAEENGNVLPSSLRSEVTPQQQESQPQYSTEQYQPLYNQKKSQGNGFPPAQQQQPPQNFGAQGASTVSGLRLQINSAANSPSTTTNQSGPKERIIPITLEQTPTYAAAQPNFGGYNNFPAPQQQQPQQRQTTQPPQQQSWREQSVQRFASPTQQTQQPNLASNNTRIIPIAVEGVRGPISPSPVVLQNDPRSPPIQSKSFRILQKITDTVDDGNPNGSTNNNSNINSVADGAQQDGPSQLQRPQFARQMSAQQARNSPSVEQMRRLQLQNNTNNNVQEQTKSASPWQQQGNTSAQPNHFVQQRSSYDMPQQYVPPSEQQVPEPKKYTGSAIPSRSFKILQAMTTPENAGPGQSDL